MWENHRECLIKLSTLKAELWISSWDLVCFWYKKGFPGLLVLPVVSTPLLSAASALSNLISFPRSLLFCSLQSVSSPSLSLSSSFSSSLFFPSFRGAKPQGLVAAIHPKKRLSEHSWGGRRQKVREAGSWPWGCRFTLNILVVRVKEKRPVTAHLDCCSSQVCDRI